MVFGHVADECPLIKGICDGKNFMQENFCEVSRIAAVALENQLQLRRNCMITRKLRENQEERGIALKS